MTSDLMPLFQIEARVSPVHFGEIVPRQWTPLRDTPAEPEVEPVETEPEPEGPHPAELALEAAERRHAEEIAALKSEIEAAREAGANAGRAERQPEIDAMSEQVADAVAALTATAEAIEARCRNEAVELALVLAGALVDDAVRHNGRAALERIVWRALENVPPADEVTLRCHPDDRELIEAHLPAVAARRGDLVDIRLTASPAIERGGLVVDFAGASVDAQPSTSLELFRDAIEGALAGVDVGPDVGEETR